MDCKYWLWNVQIQAWTLSWLIISVNSQYYCYTCTSLRRQVNASAPSYVTGNGAVQSRNNQYLPFQPLLRECSDEYFNPTNLRRVYCPAPQICVADKIMFSLADGTQETTTIRQCRTQLIGCNATYDVRPSYGQARALVDTHTCGCRGNLCNNKDISNADFAEGSAQKCYACAGDAFTEVNAGCADPFVNDARRPRSTNLCSANEVCGKTAFKSSHNDEYGSVARGCVSRSTSPCKTRINADNSIATFCGCDTDLCNAGSILSSLAVPISAAFIFSTLTIQRP